MLSKQDKNLIFLNFVPVITIHLCFLPLWLFRVARLTTITSFEMVFNLILIPLWLIIYNCFNSIKEERYNFGFNLILMIESVFLSNLLYYFNWGITTKNLLSPDGDTIALFNLETAVTIIAVAILGIIWQLILLLVKKKKLKEVKD